MMKTQIRPEFDAMDDRALRQFIAENPAHVSEDDPMGTRAELLDTAKLVADRMSEDQPSDIDTMKMPEIKDSWLRAGSLLYRLTDDPRPENCDEINVTMADGSRDAGPREARALQLMALLEQEESLKQALRWALDWIDAVPDDVMLPGMPGFDRDYVNGLLEGPDGTVE
jgi:hypothetical protein